MACSGRWKSPRATAFRPLGDGGKSYVDFRGSSDFQEWRKLVGHCFASPPEVEHVQEVVKGF